MSIGGAAFIQVLFAVTEADGMIYAAFLFLALLVAYKIFPFQPPEEDEAQERGGTSAIWGGRKYLLLVSAIVGIISLMGGMNEGLLLLADTSGMVKVYGFPRLFYLMGVVVAGYIADYKKRKYLSLCIMTIMLSTIIGILFIGNPKGILINASIYSLLAGFAIMFFTVTFLDIAPRMKNVALWASMGRIIRFVVMAGGMILNHFILKGIPLWGFVSIYVVLCILLIVLFQFSGNLQSINHTELWSVSKNCSPDWKDIVKRYHLTRREEEILRCLLDRKSTAMIAAEMVVTEKTVRNHISNIMIKTGAASRGELMLIISQRR